KIIHAEGEYQAAEKLVSAAHAMSSEPVALQLRYLQTLTEIGVEQNTTVVFPIPINLFEALTKKVVEQEAVTGQPREPVAVR
ncbi:MAG TPA: slipin family protein, partial [Blastocatellia bacterium]|nr:slipin family protein [Blastocatellia bacterium]